MSHSTLEFADHGRFYQPDLVSFLKEKGFSHTSLGDEECEVDGVVYMVNEEEYLEDFFMKKIEDDQSLTIRSISDLPDSRAGALEAIVEYKSRTVSISPKPEEIEKAIEYVLS